MKLMSQFLLVMGAVIGAAGNAQAGVSPQARPGLLNLNQTRCETNYQLYPKGALSDANKRAAFCKCSAEAYVGSITDSELQRMLDFEHRDKKLADELHARRIKTEEQCHSQLGY